MGLNNYLRIKKATSNPGFNSFYDNYFNDNGTFNSDKFFDENPDEESWKKYIGDDPYWNKAVRYDRKSYIEPQNRSRIMGLNDTYNKLTQPYGMNGTVPVTASGDMNSYLGFKDDRSINLGRDASLYTLLHERGHENAHNNGFEPVGGLAAIDNAKSLPLGYKLFNRNDLSKVLKHEQMASDYARNVISKIQDPNIRQRAMSQLEAELTPAYKTYDSYLGELLRADNRGRQIGGVAGGAIGGIGLGVGGAMLANKLLAKSKLKGWQRGLLTAGAGVLGGALGAWAGNRVGGGNLGGYAGQLYAQNKDKRTGYMHDASKQYGAEAARARMANHDIGYLNNYLNRPNATVQTQAGVSA